MTDAARYAVRGNQCLLDGNVLAVCASPVTAALIGIALHRLGAEVEWPEWDGGAPLACTIPEDAHEALRSAALRANAYRRLLGMNIEELFQLSVRAGMHGPDGALRDNEEALP